MASWRDELTEAVKTKAEREAEEAAKHRQRVQEALASAETAVALGLDALRFTHERIKDKESSVSFEETADSAKVTLGALSIGLELDRETAIVRIAYIEGKPREFDFARDRHIAATDVEEYIGRRAVELVRAAQKANPW